ncbi:peroxiredoxin-like family protein [Sphingosinicella xenopeptidilytica]|uniref:Peroxiredoxin-like family protein n=1 Tax=Sphingosinicella xenopeptidilytica TaxID=364098 RepID=A0ABW3C4V3_SPHXN
MTTESLNAQFAALHAQREKEWPPEQLQRNIAQREALVRKYDPTRHIQPGDVLEPFELIEPDGALLTRDALLADGPAVLIFFRYSGCPACNLALPYYDRQLWPALKASGVRLVAISPQVPERLDIGTRHDLGFTIASDPDNRLGRHLGITFEPEDKLPVKPGDNWIGAATGTGTWELPQPTVLVLDQRGKVIFIEVSPDWLARTEADTILAALALESLAA